MKTQRTGQIARILKSLGSGVAAFGLLTLGIAPALASTAYGTINNFDTVNDTGVECHGFEIEIEDIHSADITYTYNWNHYGTPRITEDNSDPLHPRVRIRYESAKTTNGTTATVTATPAAGFAFANWTDNGAAVSGSASYTFTNLVNRSLVANFVPMPPLSFTLPQPGTLALTWPTNDTRLVLQQNADLGSVNWVPVPDAVTVVGTNNRVSISPLVGNRFFRLLRP